MIEHEMKYCDSFRYNDDIKEKLKYILKENKEMESISHILRCGIIKIWKEVKVRNENKGIRNISKRKGLS